MLNGSGGLFVSLDELIKNSSPECEPTVMDAEDPLFILYTSGTTGKPKGCFIPLVDTWWAPTLPAK